MITDSDFDDCRLSNGTFNYYTLFWKHYEQCPSQDALNYVAKVERVRPVRSRQVAALILVRMKELTDD